MRARHLALVTALTASAALLGGCAADSLGEEDPLADILEDDDKADSLKKPTDFGTLYAGEWLFGELVPNWAQRNLSWTFSLGGDAKVIVGTHKEASEDPALPDLVAYLYEKQGGKWHLVSKASGPDAQLSLDVALDEGTYRLIVKGRTRSQQGAFLVRMDCEGDGCIEDECTFGDTIGGLYHLEHGALETYNSVEVSLEDMADRSATERAQLLETIAAASDDDIKTLAQGFDALEGGRAEIIELYSHLDGRLYNVWSVSIDNGDHPATRQSRIFDNESDEVLARADGDRITWCQKPADACLFGRTYSNTAYMPGVDFMGDDVYATAADVTDPETAAQIIAAIKVRYPRVSTLAGAFAKTDDGFNVRSYDADYIRFISVEYGAGDNSLGAYFYAGDTTPDGMAGTPVALIEDGDIASCSAF